MTTVNAYLEAPNDKDDKVLAQKGRASTTEPTE